MEGFRIYSDMEKYTDTQRLEWCVNHQAFPTKVSNWNLWCVDFSAEGGKGWYDYEKEECHKTMREAIDFYLSNEESK